MSLISELYRKTLNDFLNKGLEKQIQNYIEGNVKKHLIQTHQIYTKIAQDKLENQEKKDLKKVFKESNIELAMKSFRKILEDGSVAGAPTNSMGSSSSTQGPIQTFDPLLSPKKLKRKKPPKESIK